MILTDMTLRGLTPDQAKKIAALLERLTKKGGPVAQADGDDPPDPDGPGGPK